MNKKEELLELLRMQLMDSICDNKGYINGVEKELEITITAQELLEHYSDEEVSTWNSLSEQEKTKFLQELSAEAEKTILSPSLDEEPDYECAGISWLHYDTLVYVERDDDRGDGLKYTYTEAEATPENESIRIKISRNFRRVVAYDYDDGYIYAKCERNDEPLIRWEGHHIYQKIEDGSEVIVNPDDEDEESEY